MNLFVFYTAKLRIHFIVIEPRPELVVELFLNFGQFEPRSFKIGRQNQKWFSSLNIEYFCFEIGHLNCTANSKTDIEFQRPALFVVKLAFEIGRSVWN